MMGFQAAPAQLFYHFSLDEHVPVDHLLRRIDRHQDLDGIRTQLKPHYVVADSAYGSAENLAWLVKEKKIAPHIPVFGKSNRTDGTFSRADFEWDARAIATSARQARRWYSSAAPTRHPDRA